MVVIRFKGGVPLMKLNFIVISYFNMASEPRMKISPVNAIPILRFSHRVDFRIDLHK